MTASLKALTAQPPSPAAGRAADDLAVVLNARVMRVPMSGVQRYVQGITAHLPAALAEIAPAARLPGPAGHAWEQCVLPTRLHGTLLWSPSNTGPLAVRHQVLTLHDALPFDHPEWLAPAFRVWYRWLIPRLVRRVERIITVSHYSRDRLIAHLGIPREKIVVIPHGVDERFYPRPEPEIAAAAAALRLPSRQYLLSVCSLDPRKNLPRLLAAWEAALPAAPPDLWLVLAGRLSLPGITPRLDLRLPPRTFVTGHVADTALPPLLSGALAFAYLSLYEGFGLPLLEAMACGAPALTSGAAAIPEVVGGAALVADPADVGAITAALRRLVASTDLRAELRERGLARARFFPWSAAAALTWDLLQRAARGAA